MDKLQGARNNEAPVLGCVPEIGPSRGYKSHGTRPGRFVKRPIDERTAPLWTRKRATKASPARSRYLETFLRRAADLLFPRPRRSTPRRSIRDNVIDVRLIGTS